MQNPTIMKAERELMLRVRVAGMGLILACLAMPSARADSFSVVGSMNTARSYQMAVLLQNSEVLVAGNDNTAELYNPATGKWTSTASRIHAGGENTATLLPNGLAMLAGGDDGNGGITNGIELYNPVTGTWQVGNSMSTPRVSHTATLLLAGKVLVAGGGTYGTWATNCELYDPAAATWSNTGALNGLRVNHTATLLQNGMVLVTGGEGPPAPTNFPATLVGTNTAELYDPATGVWTFTGSMATTRYNHTATLLPNGKVLVVGGGTNIAASPELYDPVSGTWSPTPPLNIARASATTTLLPNGKVLLAGGWNDGVITNAELYDPNSGTWTLAASLNTGRFAHTATMLAGGQVLFAGGTTNGGAPLASAEVYDSTINPTITGTVTNTGGLITGRYQQTSTLLPDGTVLVAGGMGTDSYLSSAERYDPVTGNWASAGSMAFARCLDTASLLPNGKVLVAGEPKMAMWAVILAAQNCMTPRWEPGKARAV
jgi:N-acetylneuraminic acid mutarotase